MLVYLQGFEHSGSFKFLIGSVWRHPPSVTISCQGDNLEDASTARFKLQLQIHTPSFAIRTSSDDHLSSVERHFQTLKRY